jgi:hypothetical protein
MSQSFQPGDVLVFQIESGYGLLKLICISGDQEAPTWHLRAYKELFLDIDSAESAIEDVTHLTFSVDHAALTNRAFLATQVAILKRSEVNDDDRAILARWQEAGSTVTDSPVRLLLGLR